MPGKQKKKDMDKLEQCVRERSKEGKAGDFCDWVPCVWLQEFVTQLMPKDRARGTVQILALVPPEKTNARTESVKRVTLYYCPFCGTRLSENPEILKWIQNRRGPPS